MVCEVAPSFCKAFKPADKGTVEAWARKYVKIGAWSPWEGDFTTDRTPWIVEPMNRLGDSGPKRMTILGPAAGGKSTIGEVFLSWLIDNQPGFTAWYAQDEEAAKEFAETRIQRFMDGCERVRRWFPDNRHARRTQAVNFPHMSLVIQAANEGNAQSKHIRHLICDEPWLYKPGILAALHKRTTRFNHNRTILEISTGSYAGDEVDKAFRLGSKQEWQVFCPKCERHHVPKWTFERTTNPGGVKWAPECRREDGTWDYRKVQETTYYECPYCKAQYLANSANGYALNKSGKYTEPAKDMMQNHWSFHWNCIASDFSQLGAIAVEFLVATSSMKQGSMQLYQEFIQKKLAEAYDEQLPSADIMLAPSEYLMGDPWDREARRFLTVDVQKDHFWGLCRAFAANGDSRLIWCGRIASYEDIRAQQMALGVPDSQVLIDSGWNATSVYRACAQWGWLAIKGEKAPNGYQYEDPDSGVITRRVWRKMELQDPWLGTASQGQQMVRVLGISEEMTADILATFRAGYGQGWTIPKDQTEDHKQQMASSIKREETDARGVKVWRWHVVGKHGNHLWDCERYALAAAHASGFFALNGIQNLNTSKDGNT